MASEKNNKIVKTNTKALKAKMKIINPTVKMKEAVECHNSETSVLRLYTGSDRVRRL